MKVLLSIILILFNINILYSMSLSPEIGIFMNIGGSKIFTKTEVNQNKYSYLVDFKTIKGDIFVDFEAIFQLGVKNNINNNIVTGLTSLLEIGYSPYIISTTYKGNDKYKDYTFTDRVYLYSLVLSALEKIVFNNFSIGIGAGVLFPISGYGISNNPENVITSVLMPIRNASMISPYSKELDYAYIKNIFKVPVAPYIKITAEYAFRPYKMDNAEMDFVLGVYLNYNFGMKYDTSVLNSIIPELHNDYGPSGGMLYKYDYSNLDFGFTLGVSFRALE
ncbi:hypothetical protein [Brachyspira pulli]|uniref:hypothetical protein n=1 Tax=Brachyspira pulli TaxID=310721 RepID=UPI003005BA1E